MSLDKKYLIMRVNCNINFYDDDDDFGLEYKDMNIHHTDFIIIDTFTMKITREITILFYHNYEELVFNCYLFPNNIFLLQLCETEDWGQDKYRHYKTIEVSLDISMNEDILDGNYKCHLKIPKDGGFFCGSLPDIYFNNYIRIPYVYAGYIPSGKLIICKQNNLEIYYFEK